MSAEAYARSISRESQTWNPFVYAIAYTDDQNTERIIVFGLYADAYLNRHGYLVEYEADELAALLSDYNQKIEQLDAEEQNTLADIVTKRYLAGIDKQIHDSKMETKADKIDAESEEWDAKFAALEADRDALETMAAKLAVEIVKTEARIAELEALIETESVQQSYVDVEIAEKEITLARKDIEILQTANEILRIQMQTVEAAMKVVDIDMEIARTSISIAEAEARMGKTDLLRAELDVMESRVAASEADLETYDSKADLATKKMEVAQAELDQYADLETFEGTLLTAKTEKENVDLESRLAEIESRKAGALANSQFRQDASKNNIDISELEAVATETIDEHKIDVDQEQLSAARTRYTAAIRAAEMLAAANITTTLTHKIGS